MTSDQKPPQDIPPNAPAANAKAGATSAKKTATKPKTAVTKPKATAPKPKAAAPKSEVAARKPKTASKSASSDASPVKATKPAGTAVTADSDQLARQQAAVEKAQQAKAKLAKIAAAKAKKAQSNNPEQPPEPAPLAAATIAGLRKKLPHYIRLMRLDKPIGTLLLLWPTLWALWLAAKGTPSLKNLVIFSLGVLLMRSAGCVINDFADRKIDGRVARTNQRPLATGAVTSREALILFVVLCLASFGLVLCTDALTIKLSVGGLLLAASYPFMKRHTHLPQVVLGASFAWGIPMAYAAETGKLDKNMWVIYCAVVLWTVAYDTFYAMVDRDDDLKIGVKSTAILFGEQDRIITGMLQGMMLYAMVLVGKAAELGWVYYLGLAVAAGLFIYQQVLIRYREREACFKAFLNNNWVGAAIFVGIAGDLALK